MRRPILTALALLATPAPALAAADTAPAAGDIPVEEWQAMASGRTVTYRIDGSLWALERYFPGTNRVQLQLYDGTCLDGTWEYVAPHYCFHWMGQGTACFRHARVGKDIVVIQAQDGTDTPLVQDVTAVTDTPLDCSAGTS